METTIMENQMEKQMENEMETGIIMGHIRVIFVASREVLACLPPWIRRPRRAFALQLSHVS